ncbi:uncharacterized protein LOC114754959 isoform X2 [Neltuma alba]|nr:uncharacterized protein LOC114754959 isoform X2 [Prosopis alba]
MAGYALPLHKLALPRITHSSFSFTFPTSAIQLRHSISLLSGNPSTLFCGHQVKANSEFSSTSVPAQDSVQDEEENFQLLTLVKSDYNDIMIVDSPKSRVLLLDSSNNIHSILYKDKKWTEAYWDEFTSLPAVVPKGPIALLGLGGGTAAHLMLDLWPSLQLEGWEIDPILIDKARIYFGLSDLEKPTKDGGVLNIHIGDVFVPSENLHRKYAGIVVDLFSDGKVLPQLQEDSTWLELHDRLMPGGRFMVNCGGLDGGSDASDGVDSETSSSDRIWLQNPALKALSRAFPG